MQDYRQFEQRKQDHIELALRPDNQAVEHNIFDQIHLAHEALPDLDFSETDIRTQRFGQAVRTPYLISSMTAGHESAASINSNLMQACAENGWAMGVGSQRRELSDDDAGQEWSHLRRQFPNVCLFGNLGIAQVLETSLPGIKKLIHSLHASALIVHCNPLQEVIQPEGTPQFKGCWQALENLVKQLDVPLIIKETGCGFSMSTLRRLDGIGVAAVDISGLGGTHWGRIEGHRAAENAILSKTAETFKDWGVNTVQSVMDAVSLNPSFEVWGSGGVRHGLDAAKLFALGASMAGFAKPALKAALESAEHVHQWMQSVEYELKVALFCTGSRTLLELKEKLCR